MSDILDRIVARRRQEFGVPPPLAKSVGRSPLAAHENPFLAALTRARGRAVIAEVKLGSPRIGSLVGRIDPEATARSYAKHGAVALSIVVEPDFFHGSFELLTRCKAACGLPTIAKDFVVHPEQFERAKAAGADAILLIASMHAANSLVELAQMARGMGLAPLIETHDRFDVQKLEVAEWEMVGINNRNLKTFAVDLENSMDLVKGIPKRAEGAESTLKVAESGIRTGYEVSRLAAAGFDAFLIGETFLLSPDPGAALARLLDEARQ
ncbi:MAG: indole-3-glycerol phosphate synthase TrpC [Acidobacteriota bacterium]